MSKKKTTKVQYEYEYWTVDPEGRGYCSHISIEDAIEGHLADMKALVPLGPIVNVYITEKRTVTKVTTKVIYDAAKGGDVEE